MRLNCEGMNSVSNAGLVMRLNESDGRGDRPLGRPENDFGRLRFDSILVPNPKYPRKKRLAETANRRAIVARSQAQIF